jgi:2,3-bisphosphoglycerate-independent phosphoglycerate mutase
MLTTDGAPNTAHSTNPVPLILTGSDRGLVAEGTLSDVAPTVLALLGLERPGAMTGRSLLTSPSTA